MRASRNTLSAREVDYYLSGESEFGFLPLVIAAGKVVGKTAHNVAVNAQAGAQSAQPDGASVSPAAPVAQVVSAPSASPALPIFLASVAGLGLGLAAGYAVGHARAK